MPSQGGAAGKKNAKKQRETGAGKARARRLQVKAKLGRKHQTRMNRATRASFF